MARGERLRHDAVVDEVKGTPLLGPRSLEVPEDPALSVLLESFHLGFDVATGVLLVGGVPLVNELEAGAVSDVGAVGIGTVVASTNEVTWINN